MKALITTLLMTLIINTAAVAGWFTSDYYAKLQVAVPNSSLVIIMIQNNDSKGKCDNAIRDLWTGLRTTCSNCTLEDSGCSTILQTVYENIFDNKSCLFPYVALGNTRVIFTGVPTELGNQYCEKQVEYYRNKMHVQANCIRGSR